MLFVRLRTGSSSAWLSLQRCRRRSCKHCPTNPTSYPKDSYNSQDDRDLDCIRPPRFTRQRDQIDDEHDRGDSEYQTAIRLVFVQVKLSLIATGYERVHKNCLFSLAQLTFSCSPDAERARLDR